MANIIENLQKKPYKEKVKILWTAVGVITLFIVLLWVFVFPKGSPHVDFSETNRIENNLDKFGNEANTNLNNAGHNFEAIKEDFDEYTNQLEQEEEEQEEYTQSIINPEPEEDSNLPPARLPVEE